MSLMDDLRELVATEQLRRLPPRPTRVIISFTQSDGAGRLDPVEPVSSTMEFMLGENDDAAQNSTAN